MNFTSHVTQNWNIFNNIRIFKCVDSILNLSNSIVFLNSIKFNANGKKRFALTGK